MNHNPHTMITTGNSFFGAGLLTRLVRLCMVVCVAVLGACSNRPLSTPSVADAIRTELAPTTPAATGGKVPSAITQALAEPAPAPIPAPPEPKLDLLVNNANAREVFLAIVADTRYSMLMHPDVTGTISVTLRGVTVKEALDAIRDVYGYDYRMDGRRITVYAPSLQTRIFVVNYPHSRRVGRSELRVSSGGSSGSAQAPAGAAGTTGAAPTGQTGANSNNSSTSSRVSMDSMTDFWEELTGAVKSMVGDGTGRSVIASPQAGIMAVRAMPEELRQVERFLKAAQMAVERQVMLEAKIVEVELSDGYQSGVNWGAFGADSNGTGQIAAGVIGTGFTNSSPWLSPGRTTVTTTPVPSIGSGGGLFGIAFATSQFAAVLGFLETQGDVQTLSSPRVATLNNQKAVLKVGADDYYVTNVTGGSTTSSGVAGVAPSTTLPTLTLTPFFSGIALDVTPQIDDANNIMLHIHPSVTTVSEKTKSIDLGSVGVYQLPLASSNVNETDTLVRIQDGYIVAIGGLMQAASAKASSGLPGTTNLNNPFGVLFGNRSNSGRKKEVVVLIKPTIIRSQQDWEEQTARSRAALDAIDAARSSRVIQMDGAAP